MPSPTSAPYFELRHSPIQGTGAFAIRPIPAGTRIIEYLGERISHAEADRRYDDDTTGRSHVVLFVVNSRTVIDAGVDGNEARFFNHSCDPNCESDVVRGHVYLISLREIASGEELTYDYSLTRDADDDAASEALYPCRCGASNCRGTLLEAPKRRRVSRHGGAARRGAKRNGPAGRGAKRRGRKGTGVRRRRAPGRAR